MAGIGFQLKKIVNRNTYFSTIEAYIYAGVISAGPWVISIIGIALLDLVRYVDTDRYLMLNQFKVSITYLISASLIFSSFTQHSFTRFIADTFFRKENDKVLPNLMGVILLTTLYTGGLSLLVIDWIFPTQNVWYKLFMIGSFVTLCNIWLLTNMMSGLKSYRSIIAVYTLGYGVTVGLGYLFYYTNLNGMMLSFFLGQFVLLTGLLSLVFFNYRSRYFIAFDFLKNHNIHVPLLFISLFYNIGIWADKYIFWYTPHTSIPVIGLLRASPIYDAPMFLAFLTILPGLAVFLFRMEADFVDYYSEYYDAIRDGFSLNTIDKMLVQMVTAARNGIFDIAKTQGYTLVIIVVIAPFFMNWLGVTPVHQYLFIIDSFSSSLLVLLLGLLNILFYLDKLKVGLLLSALFMILNIVLTIISILLGPYYYGYGLFAALFVVDIVAVLFINYIFDNLNYTTFMV